MSNHSVKFHKYLIRSFGVILLTGKLTHENINVFSTIRDFNHLENITNDKNVSQINITLAVITECKDERTAERLLLSVPLFHYIAVAAYFRPTNTEDSLQLWNRRKWILFSVWAASWPKLSGVLVWMGEWCEGIVQHHGRAKS